MDGGSVSCPSVLAAGSEPTGPETSVCSPLGVGPGSVPEVAVVDGVGWVPPDAPLPPVPPEPPEPPVWPGGVLGPLPPVMPGGVAEVCPGGTGPVLETPGSVDVEPAGTVGELPLGVVSSLHAESTLQAAARTTTGEPRRPRRPQRNLGEW